MIQVNHLSFSYTKQPFIQDMSFSVGSGEIFGFLGPSGAGKSTLQKILLGMLPNYQGSARVNKTECKHRGSGFYESIGVDFEFSTMYEKLSAKENPQFFSSLYRRQARSIPELFTRVGLENDADKRVSDYSKGIDKINCCDCAAAIKARIEEIKFGQVLQSYKTGSVNGIKTRIKLFTEGVKEILDRE